MKPDQRLEAVQADFQYDTGTHRIYRHRGGVRGVDIQICVPLNCQKTELDYRIFLVGGPEHGAGRSSDGE